MSVLALLKKKQLEDNDWLWCIAGEEALLRDRALAHLRALCRKRQPALEESVLRGDAFSATELRNVLKNLSLFSPHRLIVIRSVESLRADDQKSLLALLEPRPEEVSVILMANELDGRSTLVKKLDKGGHIFRAEALKGVALRSFLVSEATQLKVKLSQDHAQLLITALGHELSVLLDVLEQLALYLGPDQPVDAAAIERYVVSVKQDTVWMLIDALSQRHLKNALNALRALTHRRESPLGITALIARQFRAIAKAKAALAEGLGPEDAAKRAGIPPFKARELSASAKTMHESFLAKSIHHIARAERALKGSRQPAPNVLDELIINLCSVKA